MMNNKLIESIKNGTTHMWMWKPGDVNCIDWDSAKDDEVVALSSDKWDVNIGSYEHNRASFDMEYNAQFGKVNAHVKATCLWNFAKKVEIGDIIVACTLETISGKLRYKGIGWCVVSSSYLYDPEYEEQHYREVEDIHVLDEEVILPIPVENKKYFFSRIAISKAEAVCDVLFHD